MAHRNGASVAARPLRAGDPPRSVVNQEAMLAKLNDVLYEAVSRAVSSVCDRERSWTELDMAKRIHRYLYKAAQNGEILKVPWDQAVTTFMDHAMGAYAASCQDKEWFFDLDLRDALSASIWHILSASRQPRPPFAEVTEFVEDHFEVWLNETMHGKAMWLAVEKCFPSEWKAQDKVYTSLKKTFQAALDVTLADDRPIDDLDRLKNFLRKWMEDSLTRAWATIGDDLDEDLAIRLFRELLVPFGPRNPFSCIPEALTEQIGRPPPNWAFIPQTAHSIFRRWAAGGDAGGSSASGSKRRRRGGGGAGDDFGSGASLSSTAAAMCGGGMGRGGNGLPAFPRRGPRGVVALPAPGEVFEDQEDEGSDLGAESGQEQGHPECTSQEDCQGSAEDSLIRHILNGKDGDLYCQTCWEAFLRQNPRLDGVLV